MPLRIGCDLDGVLADMEGALLREAEAILGPRRQPETTDEQQKPLLPKPTSNRVLDLEPEVSEDGPLERELHLTESERGALWAYVAGIEGFWESLEEIELGAVARLAHPLSIPNRHTEPRPLSLTQPTPPFPERTSAAIPPRAQEPRSVFPTEVRLTS